MTNSEELELIKKVQHANGDTTDKLPNRLSPSRASDYVKCPQLFYYKTICKIKTPGSEATVRGSIVHSALERIFDLPQGQRTTQKAIEYLHAAWDELKHPNFEGLTEIETEELRNKVNDAAQFVDFDNDSEFISLAEDIVRNWFVIERVNNFSPTDLKLPNGEIIDGREIHVEAALAEITAHGYVDRLDRWEDSLGNVHWAISDYKTSAKHPWLGRTRKDGSPYSEQTIEKIRNEYFFQLRLYALALYKMYGIQVRMLRLIFPRLEGEQAISTENVTAALMEQTEKEINALWRRIRYSAKSGKWNANKGPLCNWCYFQDICPAWSSDVSDIVAETNHN